MVAAPLLAKALMTYIYPFTVVLTSVHDDFVLCMMIVLLYLENEKILQIV